MGATAPQIDEERVGPIPGRMGPGGYMPSQQEKFCRTQVYEVLYGGGKYGAKTAGLVLAPIPYFKHPGFTGIIFRRNYPQLEEAIGKSNTIAKYHRLGGSWTGHDKTWRFPSGASIKFRHVEDERAVGHYQGHGYTWMGFDEVGQFPENWYKELKTCCRSPYADLKRMVRATCNPGGIGHSWLKQRFIDPAPKGETILVDRRKGQLLERLWIPSLIGDNPYAANDPTYEAEMEDLPEKLRRAYLLGDWDILAGQFFDDFDRKIHVVTWPQLREIYRLPNGTFLPKEWSHGRAFDWGWSDPYACVWFAFDHKGRMIVYQEAYGAKKDPRTGVTKHEGVKMLARDVAAEIKRRDWPGITYRTQVCDPALPGEVGSGESIRGQFFRAGLRWEDADHDRLAGWQAVHDRLGMQEMGPASSEVEIAAARAARGSAEAVPIPGGFVRRGLVYRPRMYVLDTCKEVVRTVPSLPHDEKRPDDVDTKAEDHLADALRYACMTRPLKPRKEIAKDGPQRRRSFMSA